MACSGLAVEISKSFWEEILEQTLTEELKSFLRCKVETIEPQDHFAILAYEESQLSDYPMHFYGC